MTNLVRVLSLMSLVLLGTVPAGAHPGHGHEVIPVSAGTAAPRTEAHSDLFELVLIVRGGAAVLTLDRFATNEPIEGATIEVAEGDSTAKVESQPDSTYRLAAPWLARPGRHELVFTVTSGKETDLLNASLDLPDTGQAAVPGSVGPRARLQAALGDKRGPVIAGFGFLLGVFTTLLFLARGRLRAAAGGMALLSGLLVAGAALAHPGHDGDEPTPPRPRTRLGGSQTAAFRCRRTRNASLLSAPCSRLRTRPPEPSRSLARW